MKKIPVRHIRSTVEEPVFSGSFKIRKLDEVLSGKSMQQELHRHSFYFMLILQKGSGEHIIDFIPYTVKDHTVFFMRPGQVHQLSLQKGSKGYLIEFSPDLFSISNKTSQHLLRKVSSKNYCKISPARFESIYSMLSYIHEEYKEKKEKYMDLILAGMEILFIELFRQRQNLSAPEKDSRQYLQDRLEELMEYLEKDIALHKNVAHYAEQMHLSSFQLNAVTKSALGKTCSELINDYIILEARRQLLATSNQVNQVAYQLGYEDVSYFIRFFRKQTGYTPEAFRNKQR